jgi:hypothetical protein
MRCFFILSAPRSGSTLLTTILGVHGRIVTAVESFWFVAVSRKLEHLHRSLPAPRRVEAMYQLLRSFERLDQLSTAPATLRAIVEAHQGSPDQILPALVAEFARRTKPSAEIWGEKSPPHAFHLDAIDRAFPEARYIHLVRDPRATVLSIAKPSFVDYSDDWHVATHLYHRFNHTIETGLRELPPDRHIRVHYEDLVTRPQGELERCCAFLRVEFDPAMLVHEKFERNLTGLGSVEAGKPLTRAFVAEWRTALTPVQIRCIEQFTSRLGCASRYQASHPTTSFWPYLLARVVLQAAHLSLRLTEALVHTIRGRPFVWSKLSLMLDRFLRHLTARSRVLRALMPSRSPAP